MDKDTARMLILNKLLSEIKIIKKQDDEITDIMVKFMIKPSNNKNIGLINIIFY